MVRNFLVIILVLIPSIAFGANHYVRQGGSGNGSAWNNAWDDLPITLTRGDTYYIADGSYSGYTFNDNESGSTLITIKKAIESDHGSSTGWSSAYGDGQATFGFWNFQSEYWAVDGQVGQWADWHPDYVQHGFKITRTTSGSGQKLIQVGNTGSTWVNHITIAHVHAVYGNTTTWHKNADVIYSFGSDLTYSYIWCENPGRTSVLTKSDAVGYNTFEYCVFEGHGNGQWNMGWSPSEHSETMMNYGSKYNIRYNYWKDWRSGGGSTGNLILYTGNDDVDIYGNVFFQTGAFPAVGEGNGMINGRSSQNYSNIRVYNNSFSTVDQQSGVLTSSFIGNCSNCEADNNLFYDVKKYNGSGFTFATAASHDYNWFYDSGTQSESNSQNGSGDPFTDRGSNDFTLSSATNAGDTGIGAEYNTDMLGVTRGADGTWDRGAFDFVASGTPPADVSNQSATGGTEEVGLTWTNPADADYAGVRIRYRTDTFPTGPSNGTLFEDNTGSPSATDSTTHTGLDVSTVYYYSLYAYDASNNYADGVTTQATTNSAGSTPPGDVSNQNATGGTQEMGLTWTNPADADYVGVMIRYNASAVFPTNVNDGTLFENNTGSPSATDSTTHSSLADSTQYSYTMFAYDASTNYASGVTTQDTTNAPAPASTYRSIFRGGSFKGGSMR